MLVNMGSFHLLFVGEDKKNLHSRSALLFHKTLLKTLFKIHHSKKKKKIGKLCLKSVYYKLVCKRGWGEGGALFEVNCVVTHISPFTNFWTRALIIRHKTRTLIYEG